MQQTVTITLTLDQLSIIDKALQDIPYRFSAPLIADINKQINNQPPKQEEINLELNSTL